MRQEIYALVRVIEQSIPTENTWARQIAQSLACCAQPTRDRGVATNRRSYTPAWIGSREAFGENPEMLIQWNGRPIDFAGSHDNRVTIPVEIRVPVLLGGAPGDNDDDDAHGRRGCVPVQRLAVSRHC